jgi:hypothetical protein
MRCIHLQVIKLGTIHINVDHIETLIPMKNGNTEVGMASGVSFETEVSIDLILKRIDEAPHRHTKNGNSNE